MRQALKYKNPQEFAPPPGAGGARVGAPPGGMRSCDPVCIPLAVVCVHAILCVRSPLGEAQIVWDYKQLFVFVSAQTPLYNSLTCARTYITVPAAPSGKEVGLVALV